MFEQARERLFGRRKGRPLRAGRARLMEELLPKIKLTAPEGGTFDLGKLFSFAPKKIWMEIGFGGGEHLAAQAAAHPEFGFIGCEPFVNGVASLLAHIDGQGLFNVLVCPDDARPVLDFLPSASLDRVFVLFADPWPKKRHAERRFIGPENLGRLARVMKSGGELRLATDVPVLAEWMREKATEHPDFKKTYDSFVIPHDWVPTRYEHKGRAAGREPVYMIFERK
jgi:tRNA (guanine-N7-)-methyltransferase